MSNFVPDFTKANPYEGVPQSYLKQIEGTPAYEQALKAGWIQPPTTFKPDYTKEDPYEGAPQEYIELVKETFKPTVEHPFAPFTGQVVSTDTEKGTVTVLDETGRSGDKQSGFCGLVQENYLGRHPRARRYSGLRI